MAVGGHDIPDLMNELNLNERFCLDNQALCYYKGGPLMPPLASGPHNQALCFYYGPLLPSRIFWSHDQEQSYYDGPLLLNNQALCYYVGALLPSQIFGPYNQSPSFNDIPQPLQWKRLSLALLMHQLCEKTDMILKDQMDCVDVAGVEGVYLCHLRLQKSDQKPQELWIVNPLKYAIDYHCAYINLIEEQKILFVGMNPSPETPTGIPFYDTNVIDEEMFYVNALPDEFLKYIGSGPDMICDSAERLWRFIENTFVSTEDFFRHCYIINYSPLIFMRKGKRTFKNVPFNDFDQSIEPILTDLMELCRSAFKETLKILQPQMIVAVGKYAENRIIDALQDWSVRDALPGVEVKLIKHPAWVPRMKIEPKISLSDKTSIWIQICEAVLKARRDWLGYKF